MLSRRIRFATVAVTGLGAFVAVAVGVTLYFGAIAGLRSTQELISEQAESHLDALEGRIAGRLAPVEMRASAIAGALAGGSIDLARSEALDAFMLGALAAAPEVSLMGIVEASGKVRRWSRAAGAAAEDWSERKDVRDWLAQGATRRGGSWRAPLWAPVERVPALLHDRPLYRDGRFVGMLGQVVSIAALSQELAQFRDEHRVTPFILYGDDEVLAHPRLARAAAAAAAAGATPLAKLAELDDPVLRQLRSAKSWEPLGLRALRNASGGHAMAGGDAYLYVERAIEGYGPRRWTLGVYFDPVAHGQRAQMLRMLTAIGAGLAVLAAAVAAAAIAGRRIARPVEALARAAAAVRAGRLEAVPALAPSAIAELDDARRSFGEMVAGLRERRVMRDTLGQFVPEQVASALLAAGGRLEPVEAEATILVCDIEGFAALTDALGPRRTFEFLNAYFEHVVGVVEAHGGVITQFQGDAILAVFNLPLGDPEHAAQALRAALKIVRGCDERAFGGVRVRNRVGLSTGSVIAGAVGAPGRLGYTVHGNAVNLAARIEAANKDYGTRILLSGESAGRCAGFALRKVADAAIRGYAEPVALYTPLAG